MSKFVSVYANGKKGDPVVTVTEAFARSIEAKVLEDEPAVDTLGKPLAPREAGAYLNPPEPNFAPAIELPEGFEPKTEEQLPQTPDTTQVPATNTPIGGPAVSPEEASK